MARPGLSVEITPTSNRLLNNLQRIEFRRALDHSLDEIASTVMGKTLQAWPRKAQQGEGGLPWPDNFGKYAELKAKFLNQNPVQPGVITGLLRDSIAFNINRSGLKVIVGTPQKHGPAFAEGGPGPDYITLKNGDQYRRCKAGGTVPPRPFLPTETEATKIAEYVVIKNLSQYMNSKDIVMRKGGTN